MDITMIGLQNAGKTSLLRVLAVSESLASVCSCDQRTTIVHEEDLLIVFQGGEFTIECVAVSFVIQSATTRRTRC